MLAAALTFLTLAGAPRSIAAPAGAGNEAHLVNRSPSRGQALAAGCTPCHQPGLAGIPTLPGQTRAALRAKLEGFREGTLAGTVMPQLARGYSAVELDALAQWFASEPVRQ